MSSPEQDPMKVDAFSEEDIIDPVAVPQDQPKAFNKLSLYSLIIGLVSFFIWELLLIVPIVGIIIGLLSFSKFDPTLHKGKWMGAVGFILSAVSVVLSVNEYLKG